MNFCQWLLGAIAHGCQIGHQADEPENQRHGQVGRNREHVPDQRAARLRPQPHRVGVGKQPIRQPRTAQVQNREHAGAGDGEQRHGFRKSVDRRAPVLFQQQQNRRDQRAGVADTDPPHEVDDGEAPGHRDDDAPHSDALVEQPESARQQALHGDKGQKQTDPPLFRRGLDRFQDDAGDLVGDRTVVVSRPDDLVRAGVDYFRL